MTRLDPMPDIIYEEAFDLKQLLPQAVRLWRRASRRRAGPDFAFNRTARPEGRLGAGRHHQIPQLSIQALGVGANVPLWYRST